MTYRSNIERGATATKSGILVGGSAEYCLCGSVLSNDGCIDPNCLRARPSLKDPDYVRLT
jgi:hypothetical protein